MSSSLLSLRSSARLIAPSTAAAAARPLRPLLPRPSADDAAATRYMHSMQHAIARSSSCTPLAHAAAAVTPYRIAKRCASITITGTSAREFEHELESLLECLVVLLESSRLESSNLDVNLADGVLSVASPTKGTWILNKHTPTRQIWLSSPVSGPRKFNFHSAARSAESTGEGWLGERDQTEELKTMIIDEWSAAFGVTIDRVEDFPIAHE